MTVDGADEVSDSLDLIKGLGGALVREKVVAHASKHVIIVVDESKLTADWVSRLRFLWKWFPSRSTSCERS